MTYSMVFIGIKPLGAGQFYLMTIKNKNGQGFGGKKQLPLDCAGERPGQAVLVGNDLRPFDPCADSQSTVGQPILPVPGTAKEMLTGRWIFTSDPRLSVVGSLASEPVLLEPQHFAENAS